MLEIMFINHYNCRA